MYIYNVTIKVTHEIELEWLKWMREEHMQEVLDTQMFDQYQLFALLEPEDEDGKTYIAQYQTAHYENYEEYVTTHAPLLREKGFAKFGANFIAFRSLLRKI